MFQVSFYFTKFCDDVNHHFCKNTYFNLGWCSNTNNNVLYHQQEQHHHHYVYLIWLLYNNIPTSIIVVYESALNFSLTVQIFTKSMQGIIVDHNWSKASLSWPSGLVWEIRTGHRVFDFKLGLSFFFSFFLSHCVYLWRHSNFFSDKITPFFRKCENTPVFI